MIITIAQQEIRTLFLSPLAWIILAVIQVLLGYMFLAQLDNFFLLQPQLSQLDNVPGVTDIVIAPLFSLAAIILLMIMPLITMRSIAEEKRNKTLTLLVSSPISMTEIVLGKFLGLFFFVFILVSLLMLMPLSLFIGTPLDIGKLWSIFISMLLLLSSFAAIGLYLSSLTDNQTIAAVSTFGALIMLWIIDWVSEVLPRNQEVISYLSLLQHHQTMLEGIFNSADVAYYLIFITVFLVLTIRQLDRGRLL
jgi:ABC-2 type transport system permease protein|tara:strand:- start:431 stop:1180 length:750 start_codon:yes stop_codon:yes gene_type:complete